MLFKWYHSQTLPFVFNITRNIDILFENCRVLQWPERAGRFRDWGLPAQTEHWLMLGDAGLAADRSQENHMLDRRGKQLPPCTSYSKLENRVCLSLTVSNFTDMAQGN
mgnify:CR=1 FL=1